MAKTSKDKMILLSILIPTIPKREIQLHNLCCELSKQLDECGFHDKCEILIDPHQTEFSVGQKRNGLLELSRGKYVCFFDDDDWPEPEYIKHIFEGINKGVDCVSLRGVMTTNGNNPEVFEHSLIYNEWRTNKDSSYVKYERYPNHLNTIISSVAKKFKFPEIRFGEDHKWSKALFESGLLKTEHYINKIIYNYKYSSQK